MHKEIEEAREWAKIHRAASTKISFGAQAIRHIERLLDLFDRMQQEPVVRLNHAGEIPQECKSFSLSLDDGPVPSPGTYRRELEDK